MSFSYFIHLLIKFFHISNFQTILTCKRFTFCSYYRPEKRLLCGKYRFPLYKLLSFSSSKSTKFFTKTYPHNNPQPGNLSENFKKSIYSYKTRYFSTIYRNPQSNTTYNVDNLLPINIST